MTSTDPLEDLLGLEDGFYKEGYDAGVVDSTYAGLIEGKVFGIEKGYEKALELGRLHGRALVWKQRLATSRTDATLNSNEEGVPLPSLRNNARLGKQIDLLLSLTDPKTMSKDNSDDSVTQMDDKIAKSKARAKMVSNMVGEEMGPSQQVTAAGIEDSTGLSARH